MPIMPASAIAPGDASANLENRLSTPNSVQKRCRLFGLHSTAATISVPARYREFAQTQHHGRVPLVVNVFNPHKCANGHYQTGAQFMSDKRDSKGQLD